MKVELTVKSKDNLTLTDALNDYISKEMLNTTVISDPAPRVPQAELLRWFGGKALKGAIKMTGYLGDNTLNSLLEKLKHILTGKINQYLDKKNISISVRLEKITKEKNEMKINIDVNNVDYSSIINKFLPDVIVSLREKDGDSVLWQITDVIKDVQPQIIKTVLNELSEEKKEQIIKILVDTYNNEICEKISGYLSDQKINFAVTNIDIS